MRPQEAGTRRQEVATILSFPASLDARVEAASPTRNFGHESKLVADQSPERESFLRFHVSGVTGLVKRAVLRLYALDGTSRGPLLYRASNDWQESNFDWNTRPAFTGGPRGDLGPIEPGTWVEYDVSGTVTSGGDYSFGLLPGSTNGVDVVSPGKRQHPRAHTLRGALHVVGHAPLVPRLRQGLRGQRNLALASARAAAGGLGGGGQ